MRLPLSIIDRRKFLKYTTLAATVIAASSFVAAHPAYADDKLQKVLKNGKVIFGIRTELKDFGYLDPVTNQISGFDIDIAKQVSKEMFGKEGAIELVAVNAQNRITQLNTERVDVLAAALSVTPDRMKEVSFSNIYFLSGQSLLVKSNSNITSYKDLSKRKICAVVGSSQEAIIRKLVPDAEVLTYARGPEALLALKGGRCDGFSYGISVLREMASSNPDTKLTGGLITFEALSLAVKKGNDSLLNAVNDALGKIKKDGRYAAIYRKWVDKELPNALDQWYGMSPKDAADRYAASQ